jgi:hypothetical protein
MENEDEREFASIWRYYFATGRNSRETYERLKSRLGAVKVDRVQAVVATCNTKRAVERGIVDSVDFLANRLRLIEG